MNLGFPNLLVTSTVNYWTLEKHDVFQSDDLMACAMIFILYGSSEHGAHICSKTGISICLRHIVVSKESSI